MLLDLPIVVKLSLLSEWLGPMEIGNLDLSLCSHDFRMRLLLEFISDPSYNLPDCCLSFGSSFVCWLRDRRIRVKSLSVHDFDFKVLADYIISVNPSISSVEIHGEQFDQPFDTKIEGLHTLKMSCDDLSHNDFTNIFRMLLNHKELSCFHLHFKHNNAIIGLDDSDNDSDDSEEESAYDRQLRRFQESGDPWSERLCNQNGEFDENAGDDLYADMEEGPDADEGKDGVERFSYKRGDDWDYSEVDCDSSDDDDDSVSPAVENLDISSETGEKEKTLFSVLSSSEKLVNLTSFVCTHHDLCDGYLIAVANIAPNLREIDVSGCVSITKVGFLELFLKCPFLQSFTASNCSIIDDDIIQALTDSCRNLEHWRIVDISIDSSAQVTEASLRHLAKSCLELKSWTCSGVDLSELLLVISKHCPKFEKFDGFVDGATWSHYSAVKTLFSTHGQVMTSLKLVKCDIPAFNCFTEPLSNLKTLDLSWNRLADSLKSVGDYCMNLTEFSLSGNRDVSTDVIEYILSRCVHIEVLDLCNNANIETTVVYAIANHLPELRWLDVSCCERLTKEDVWVLLIGCSKLKYLNLACCPLITMDHVVEIATVYWDLTVNYYE